MSDRHRLYHALLARDLPSFIAQVFNTLEPGTPYEENWHVCAIAHQLMRAWSGETNRLIINVPPRMMKSISVTIAFTAWVLGHDPTKKIITVTYAREFARKHALDFRTIVQSAWFARVFPDCRIETRRSRDVEIVTTLQGYRYAGAMGGSVLGRGADLIIIDDPIKAIDALSEAERRRVIETYTNTLYTRLNSKREGAIVIIMQRLHEDDLVGHVLDKEDWEVLSIPAIADEDRIYQIGPEPGDIYLRRAGEVLHPEREGAAELELIRRNLGSMNFQAQYQQNPMPMEGNIIRREWLRYYDAAPADFDLIIASWDTASTLADTSDWSVGTVWGAHGQDFYLLHLERFRAEYPDLRRAIKRVADTHAVDITLIEDTELGRAANQELRRSGLLRPILTRPKFDKTARMLAQSARFEAGQVLLPREAVWLGEFTTELLAFPQGRHDDQVDSTAQALRYLTARTAPPHPIERRSPRRRPSRRRSEGSEGV